MTWIDNPLLSGVGAAIVTALGALAATRVKRAISRDDALLRGYGQFTSRLVARVEALEKERDEREEEYRERMFDMETRLRVCESDRANLRGRIADLERVVSGMRGGQA